MKPEVKLPGDVFDWNEWRREDERERRSGAARGSAASPYEMKSLGGADYYICVRDTENRLAKILRGVTNQELIELKKFLDGKMPPNNP